MPLSGLAAGRGHERVPAWCQINPAHRAQAHANKLCLVTTRGVGVRGGWREKRSSCGGRTMQCEECASWWGRCTSLLGCTLSSLCSPFSLCTPSRRWTPSGKEQLRRPRTSSTHQKQMPLSSLQKVHLFKVPTLLPVHTLREVHRSKELHTLRVVHTSERCCQHKPISCTFQHSTNQSCACFA